VEALALALTKLDVDKLTEAEADRIRREFIAPIKSNNGQQLAFLREILPAAQSRGIQWHIGVKNVGQWGDVGNLYVRDAGEHEWTELGGDQRVAAITARKGTDEHLYPYLVAFVLERTDDKDVGQGAAENVVTP